MEPIKPGIYRHYKGNLYEVIGVAIHSETDEEMVVYRALYGEYGLFVRPKNMFQEEVGVKGLKEPRFKLFKPF
ncbi:MAG TPA: DUF1653 domain-containing protein [Nitrospiria bacterium]|jgi:hypothetical protein